MQSDKIVAQVFDRCNYIMHSFKIAILHLLFDEKRHTLQGRTHHFVQRDAQGICLLNALHQVTVLL